MNTEPTDAPWGEISFERDRNWYGHLPRDSWEGDEKERYRNIRQKALDDPSFDFFEHFMPTGRPKHDIGRYVLRHSIAVPLVRSMSEWQEAVMQGHGMLRSEHPRDYDGLSGLYRSSVLHLHETYPRNEHGGEDRHFELSEDKREYVLKRTYEGPIHAELDIGHIESINSPFSLEYRLGSSAVTGALRDILRSGLYDGTVNPAAYMRLAHWDQEHDEHMSSAQFRRYTHSLKPSNLEVSRWKYIPGINVSIFRDNVVEGKYFLRGRDSHHHWEVTDGIESPDVVAHDKAGYRGRASYDSRQYTLPTSKIIALYEKVRTLPFFDQRQAPMMEFQYGADGKLYFLQYLKTGLQLNDPGEFTLPMGDNVVTSYDVRGVTKPEGEKMRIYMDPKLFTKRMRGQGFFDRHNMHTARTEQIAALSCRAMIMDTMLSFKDNHWSSAPLYRAPVAIGTWNGDGEVHKRFNSVQKGVPFKTVWEEETDVHYIDAIVTSNGRAGTIESDWELKKEVIN